MSRFIRIVCLLSIFAGTGVLAQTSVEVEVDIPAQPVGDALNQFAEQSGLQVVLYADDVEGIETEAVIGKFDDRELVLDALLASTGLEYFFINDRTVSVSSLDDDQGGDSDSKNSSPAPVLMAQNQTSPPQSPASQQNPPSANEHDELEEIVVVGTRIRGGLQASPSITITREEILQTGYSSTEQLLERLPQNLASLSADKVVNLIGEPTNITGGSAVNLRGLGPDSTLVLLNGRRVAPSTLGEFVDVSMIPLSALDRVEVLTDGASAIYGSDAIGGVVNFITRESYEGVELGVRYGSVTDGELDELRLNGTLGASWARGQILISAEVLDRENLPATDRDFGSNLAEPFDILGSNDLTSIVATLSHSLAERVDVFADFFYTDRETEINSNFAFEGPAATASESEQITATVGAGFDLAETWRLEALTNFSSSEVFRNRLLIPSGDPVLSQPNEFETDLLTFEVIADSSLYSMAGGDAKLAIGASFRDEELDDSGSVFGLEEQRDAYAIFGEILFPFVSQSNRSAGVERLELSIAGRYEDYSDFGDSTNPKFGVLWTPIQGLNVRGTWGTSFRAPLLFELRDSVTVTPILAEFPDPSAPDGTSLVILLQGDSNVLSPEEATTWTLGIDWDFASFPGFRGRLTYFDVEFEDRIAAPAPGLAVLDVLEEEASFASIITRNPSEDLVTPLLNSPDFFDFYGLPYTAADIEAIIDNVTRNIGDTRVSGVELSLSYSTETGAGPIDLDLSMNYYLGFENRVTSTAPYESAINKPFLPVDLKARASLAWSPAHWQLSAYANYTDGYTNDFIVPEQQMSSWTTFDLRAAYVPEAGNGGFFDGFTIALSAQNIFDRDPPLFVYDESTFTDQALFDPVNSDPTGRFLALEVTKSW